MKKVISTTLTLTMLATPLIGSTCFADKVKNDKDSYVQEQDRREQFKFKQQKICRMAKLAGCVAVETAVVVGTAIVALKLFEEELPESVRKWLPGLFSQNETTWLTGDGINYGNNDQSSFQGQPVNGNVVTLGELIKCIQLM